MEHILVMGIGVYVQAVGFLKAREAHAFVQHLFQMKLFPVSILRTVACIVIALEWAVGYALWNRIHLVFSLYTCFALLCCFMGIAWWAKYFRQVENCGCYGKILKVSVFHQSFLNVFLLLAIVYLLWNRNYVNNEQIVSFKELSLVVSVGLLGGLLSFVTSREKPVPATKLYKGNSWGNIILGENDPIKMADRQLIAFLNTSCSSCKRWYARLNVLNYQFSAEHSKENDFIVAFFPMSEWEVSALKEKEKMGFEVRAMNRSLFDSITGGTATVIVLEKGIVMETWAYPNVPSSLEQIIKTLKLEKKVEETV